MICTKSKQSESMCGEVDEQSTASRLSLKSPEVLTQLLARLISEQTQGTFSKSEDSRIISYVVIDIIN